MTSETLMLVPLRLTEEHGRLLGDIRSAAARSLKADAGDRSDVVRFEALCVQLEKAAERHATETGEFHELDAETTTRVASHVGPAVAVGQDAPAFGGSLLSALRGSAASRAEAWLREDRVVVAVSDPLRTGVAANEAPGESPPPAERWQAADGAQGKKAVIQRFRAQLVEATTGAESDQPVSFNPSGINNQVITEVLREFVRGSPEETVRVGVEYRDGSQASHPFPLRSLQLADTPPTRSDIELRLGLLSIRHTEMDAVVDGAWLRNSEVSRPRAAALTDDFVFDTSRHQLRELTSRGSRSVTMRLFQTGLDAAIVGFYRSVAEHLIEFPGSLTVTPMFYVGSFSDDSVIDESARFREGKPWTTTGMPGS